MRRFGLSEREQERVWELAGRGHVVASGGAQAEREAGVCAPLCQLNWRGEAGAEEALEAVPVEA